MLIVLAYCVNNLDPLIAENKVETVPADIDANSNVTQEETETTEIDVSSIDLDGDD